MFTGRAIFSTLVLMFVFPFLTVVLMGQSKQQKGGSAQVGRGKYLSTIAGCNDCHSPKIFTPMGPAPDTTRLLSGHPANAQTPNLPPGIVGMTPDTWGGIGTGDFTGWSGAWGTSFAANLTPDKETGLGSWTPEMFIKAMRTGKHMGSGRDILPPMPWYNLAQMSEPDLKALFAYLHSLPPISNAVPDPVPPAEAPKK